MFESIPTDFASIGALIAGGTIAVALWPKIKSLVTFLYSRVIVTVKLSYPLDQAAEAYLTNHFKKSKYGIRFFAGLKHIYVRPKEKFQFVALEQVGNNPTLYRRGFRFLVASYERDESDRNASNQLMSIGFLRWTFNPTALVKDIEKYWNDIKGGKTVNRTYRFAIMRIFGTGGQGDRHGYNAEARVKVSQNSSLHNQLFTSTILSWTINELGHASVKGKALSSYAMTPEIREAVEEARHWYDGKDWYHSRGVSWQRGWLLYGKPGTGKTSLVNALAQDLDLPVYIYDLASLSNREFVEAWTDMLESTPAIALIEDLDAVFEGRHNVIGEVGGGLTFDCLLNCLSGMEKPDGLFTIITTNRIDQLDEAIGIPKEDGSSTRPGRVDRILKMGPLNKEGRIQLANIILTQLPHEIDSTVSEGEGDTGADFQERCTRKALNYFWKDKV